MDAPLIQLRTEPAPTALVDRSARTVRYARISLLDRCNLRCTYCRPERDLKHVPREGLLSLEEIEQLCRRLVERGVDRVRLTGGEPTLRRDLVWLVERLAKIETGRAHHGGRLEVVMTTNGLKLPDMSAPLRSAGLSRVTVSADSLRADRFAHITRGGDIARVVAGIEAALSAGFEGTKLNVVAIEGFNDDELGEISEWSWERDITPRFIETMPMAAGRLWVPGELLPAAKIRESVATQLGLSLVEDDGDGVAGFGPARYVRVAEGPWAGRRLGTIGPMTENFCDSCNRIRVTPRGRLHACLARPGDGDLRAAIRGEGPSVDEVLDGALERKLDRHDFQTDGAGGPDHAMIQIGG